MSDIAKELFKGIVTNTADAAAFGDAIKQKMDQELSMRKVGLASKIYNQTAPQEGSTEES